MEFVRPVFLILCLALVLGACAPVATPTLELSMPQPVTTTPIPPTATALPPATFTPSPSVAPSQTPTALPTETPTITPTATSTETISEMLQSHIVFYLIVPEGQRRDACGNIKVEPIISKRMRTGDKLQDVQIALKILFSVGVKYYGPYYNALWDTQFTIESTEYNAQKDYMTITFGGYFPFTKLSDCDKHGIREQVWATFFHYEFREKTFKYYDKFLIDRLGGN